jgi:hypothetical protein
LGNLDGVRWLGLLKEKYAWVSSLDPEIIKIFSLSEVLASLGYTGMLIST